MLRRYLHIIRKRNFSLLWFGQIISQFGERLTQIALVGLISKASMSAASLASVMSMAVIPVFIISPIAGVYIDRWSKKKTMYTADLIRSVFILLIPFLFLKFKTMLPIYILIFLSFSAGRFFIPAKMSFIPRVVSKGDIFMANSLISITATIAAILGIGFGGVIIEKYGVTVGFILNATTFFISAMAIMLINVRERGEFIPKDIIDIGKEVVGTMKKSFAWELREGIRYIINSHETKYAFKTYLFLFAYIGGLYVVFIRFIQGVLSSVTKDLGFSAVFLGAGIFTGSVLYGRFAHRFAIKRIVNYAILAASAYLIFFVTLLISYPYTWLCVSLSFILGITISPAFVGINVLIHSESDTKLLGRIFSGLEFTSHLGFLIAMFISSILADIFQPFTIIIFVAIIGILFSLIFIFTDD